MAAIENGRNVSRIARLIYGGVMMLCIGLNLGWSIFREPLTEIFPEWTATRISVTFTIAMIVLCIGGFVSGKLSTRISYRAILRIAATCILAGFVLVTLLLDPKEEARSLLVLYICYGGLFGFGVGFTFVSIPSSVIRWFPDRAGLSTGLLMFGYGMGGMALGSVVNAFAKSIGIINTFAAVGAIIAVVIFVLSLSIRVPSSAELAMIAANSRATVTTSSRSKIPEHDFSITQVFRSSAFWLLFFWGATAAAAGMTVINSAANIAGYFGAPALLGLISSVFFSLGCLLFGYFFDRLGSRRAMLLNAAFLLIGGVSLVLGAVAFNIAFVIVGISCVGFGFGGNPGMMPSATMRLFGDKNFNINFGAVTFCCLPAALIGPLVSSGLQEAAGGSYLPAFIMVIIISALNLVTVFGLSNVSKKRGLEN